MDWGSEMTEHKNIYMALCAAQAGMGKVVKGATNPAFKSKYADLGDVVSVAVPALNEQGVAMFHYMLRDEHGAVMRTTLVHGASGTEISCDVPLIINKNDMQGMKSATTYAKRIGLESLTGIAPEDDDGNAAAKAAPKAERIRLIGAEQLEAINSLIFYTSTDEVKFCAYWQVETLEDLTDKQAVDAIAMLKKKAAQQGVESGTAQ